QAPYLPQCGAISATPYANRLAALPELEQYAALELWRGTMTAHSAIVRWSEATQGARIRFDDGRWPGDGPLRLPSTLCVQEGLPTGAAAVLLNRAHPYHDLILAIDTQEKRLFDAIDGRRAIGEIVDRARQSTDGARAFFERLWRYDQVAFDVSK